MLGGVPIFDHVLPTGLLVSALVALSWTGAEGPGMTLGVGATIVAIYLGVYPLGLLGDDFFGLPILLGLAGGALTAVAGLVEVLAGRSGAGRTRSLPQWGPGSSST